MDTELEVSEGETMQICAVVVQFSDPECPIQFDASIAIFTEADSASRA